MGDSLVERQRSGHGARRCGWAWLTSALLLAGAVQADPHRILWLSSEPPGSPGSLQLRAALQQRLLEIAPEEITFHFEDLDMASPAAAGYETLLVDMLATKYAARPPDVLIAIGPRTLPLVAGLRDRLSPRAALCFGWVDQSDLAGLDLEGMAGVASRWNFDDVLDRALALLPQTRRVVLIVGDGLIERHYEPLWRGNLAHFAERVTLDWWVGLPLDEIETRIAHLPSDTIVLNFGVYRDRTGAAFVPAKHLERIAKVSSAPIFGPFSPWLGFGVVGDSTFDLPVLGKQLAEVVARLLKGESPSAVGVVAGIYASPAYDARQLARWRIPPGRLPEGSRVLYQAPSIWQTHGRWLAAGLVLIGTQATLLALVAIQWVKRRRSQLEEQRLRRLQEAIVDSLPARIAILDRQGRIVTVNREWRAFPHGDEGPGFEVGGDYLAAARAAVARGRAGASATVEALDPVLAGRGERRVLEYAGSGADDGRWFEISVMPLGHRDGGAVVEIVDVTERREAGERFRAAIEALPVAMLLVTEGGRIELLNAQCERLFGYRRQDLLGQPVTKLLPEVLRDEWRSVALDPVPPLDWTRAGREVTGYCGDGLGIVVHVRLQAVQTAREGMVLVAITDLTDQRRLERERALLRIETAHYGRLATVGELSAAIAHELNQPLTGIVSNAQAAQAFLAQGSASPELLAETLADIAADGQRAGEIIRRLRSLLRKGPFDLGAVDLNDATLQVVRLLTQELLLHDAAIDLELAPDLPPVLADRVHFQQVVLNLVLNAVAAMTESRPEERRIRLRTLRGAENTVRLEVRDAGSGISADAMQRLFEPFYTTKPDGMGMGLPIVRSIVENHGGKILVANNPSSGATFTVVLPAAAGDRGGA